MEKSSDLDLIFLCKNKKVFKTIVKNIGKTVDIKNFSNSCTSIKSAINKMRVIKEHKESYPRVLSFDEKIEWNIVMQLIDSPLYDTRDPVLKFGLTRDTRLQCVKTVNHYFRKKNFYFIENNGDKEFELAYFFKECVKKTIEIDDSSIEMVPEIFLNIQINLLYLKENCIYFAASTMAKYIDFLFSKYSSTTKLCIRAYDNKSVDFSLILFTIEQITNSKIETISDINFLDLMFFLDSTEMVRFEFFSHLKSLRNIEFSLSTALSRHPRNYCKLCIKNLRPFFNDIKKIENCSITLDGMFVTNAERLIDEIIAVAGDVGLKVKIGPNLISSNWKDISNGVCPSFFTPANHIVSYGFNFMRLSQISYFFDTIKRFENLKTLQIIAKPWKSEEFKSLKLTDQRMLEIFETTFTSENTKRVPRIELLSINTSCYGHNFESFMCFKILSIIPTSLKFLSLTEVQVFSKKMTLRISKSTKKLEYLFISIQKRLYKNCLSFFPNLKYFAFNSHLKIKIPKHIEVVVYLPYDSIDFNKIGNLDDMGNEVSDTKFMENINYLKRKFRHYTKYICNERFSYYLFFNDFNYCENHQHLFKFIPVRYGNIRKV